MGIRQYARGITEPHLADAMSDFTGNPSSDNWMLVERAMKAHQMAVMATDDELELFLHDAPREETVQNLVVLFDSRMAAIERDLLAGHVRLVKALPNLRH